MRTVLLDCDDVLLNWLEGFRAYMSVQLNRDICERGPDSWFMHKWLGIPEDEVVPHIAAFNESAAFADLNPIDGALEAIATLSQDAELHVLTSCSSDQATWDMRYDNLKKHFGPVFKSLVCLDLGQSKHDELSKYSGDVVWVEDNLKNAMLGVALGHRTYLRRTSHNRRLEADSDKRKNWFTHWDELNLEEL